MAGPGAAGEGAGLSGFALLPWPPLPWLPIATFSSSVHMAELGCQLLLPSRAFMFRHRDRLTSFVNCTSQIPGESSDWLFGSGAHCWANGQAPSANLQPSGGHGALGGQVWEAQGAIPTTGDGSLN